MSLRKPIALVVALFLAASSAAAFQAKAPDLTGTWTGTLTSTTSSGERDEDPAHIVLKQKGAEITGTGGPGPERQMTIENGKVSTVKNVTSVTFSVKDDGGGPTIHFDLKLVEGRLKGNAKAEMNGQTRNATLDVGRAK